MQRRSSDGCGSVGVVVLVSEFEFDVVLILIFVLLGGGKEAVQSTKDEILECKEELLALILAAF